MLTGNSTDIWYRTLKLMEIECLLNVAQKRVIFNFSIHPNSNTFIKEVMCYKINFLINDNPMNIIEEYTHSHSHPSKVKQYKHENILFCCC